ncbi:MAG: hypothetical protein DRJ06_06390 [Candidatus Aminicenantes bacterium]|nr:MAG: hypothetical protein DRJ06_06390 [Candidatus Aminicenantes bacterium]
MNSKEINRRDFLQLLGLGTTALATGVYSPRVLGKTARGVLVESENEYGGFIVEKLKRGNLPYQYDAQRLKAFSEKMNIFSRNFWDPARQNRPELTEDLTYEYLVKEKGSVPNQTRLDFAFMQAAWLYAQKGSPYDWESRGASTRFFTRLGRWKPAEIGMNWAEATLAIKHAALFYGASLAGVAKLNRLWLYTDCFSPSRDNRERAIPVLSEGERFERTKDAWYIPESMNRVIALAFEEDYYAIANSPGRLASAATGNGYSRMAVTATTLAEFIRYLGYRAIPAGNGVGLSIPMAIDAGLGELGRMGLLVTPKYGPRVRLAKVITDMPLLPDAPIRFGVTEFCEACHLCAQHCPSKAISDGARTWEGKSLSNNPGIFKWYIEPEKCYDFNGFSCSNCKRVCPFNKPNNSWLHRLTRAIVQTKMKSLDKVMVTLDQASGYGQQLEDKEFWRMDGQKSITAREKM